MRDFKIVAVDFDGTLCDNKWPNIGTPNHELIWELRVRHACGEKVILWTCRRGEILDEAVVWCKKNGLILDAVNENLPEVIEEMGGDSRKIFADEYIDDKSIKDPSTFKFGGLKAIFKVIWESLTFDKSQDPNNEIVTLHGG